VTTALTRADLLRSRLNSFRAKVDRARAVLDEAFAVGVPYVAFSGGKDSLVVLDLAARARPGVTAVWVDDELEHDEQPTYVPRAVETVGARLVVKTGTQLHAGWFRSWSEEPFWRDPLPGTLVTRESIRVLAPRWGFRVAVLGLRRDEAVHRRAYLAARGRLHAAEDGVWRCNPLAGWTVDDVWAYLAARGLPVNPVYAALTAAGVPRSQQRVGPLPLAPGWVLRRVWPLLHRRLVERYGERW
jgi:phosphoadenosine phosphosulfate reductase